MKQSSVHGIYLAAGLSTRMGTDKLSLPVGGIALGNHALLAALQAGLEHVWIITGEAGTYWLDEAFLGDKFRTRWTVIQCHDARSGQGHSLRRGVQAALSAGSESVMILLADQPLITAAMIRELLESYTRELERTEIHFAAAQFNGLARPPVICHDRMYSDLLQLQGDQGARQLIRQGRPGVCIPFGHPDLFLDVDTAEDYKSLREKTDSWPKS